MSWQLLLAGFTACTVIVVGFRRVLAFVNKGYEPESEEEE